MAETETAPAGEPRTVALATISERLLAFLLDAFLFLLAAGSLALWVGPLGGSGAEALGGAAIAIAFAAYHAAFTAWAGRTPGKWIAGIGVVDPETGEPPTALRAGARALAYLLCALPLGAGFLWALLDGRKRGWHDLLAGTVVVTLREKGTLGRYAVPVAAWGLVVLLAAGAARNIAQSALSDARAVAEAREALAILAGLEERHRKRTGRYTNSLVELSAGAGLPADFLRALPTAVLEESLEIRLTRSGYVIAAKARDSSATPVELAGPPAR